MNENRVYENGDIFGTRTSPGTSGQNRSNKCRWMIFYIPIYQYNGFIGWEQTVDENGLFVEPVTLPETNSKST